MSTFPELDKRMADVLTRGWADVLQDRFELFLEMTKENEYLYHCEDPQKFRDAQARLIDSIMKSLAVNAYDLATCNECGHSAQECSNPDDHYPQTKDWS